MTVYLPRVTIPYMGKLQLPPENSRWIPEALVEKGELLLKCVCVTAKGIKALKLGPKLPTSIIKSSLKGKKNIQNLLTGPTLVKDVRKEMENIQDAWTKWKNGEATAQESLTIAVNHLFRSIKKINTTSSACQKLGLPPNHISVWIGKAKKIANLFNALIDYSSLKLTASLKKKGKSLLGVVEAIIGIASLVISSTFLTEVSVGLSLIKILKKTGDFYQESQKEIFFQKKANQMHKPIKIINC